MEEQQNDLVEKLKSAHGENLVAVIEYGSPAEAGSKGDPRRQNLLVVLKEITPSDLRLAHSVAESLQLTGPSLPLYFTQKELAESTDVFPIEFIDFARAHRVLWGSDPFAGLNVPTHNLRHQLEYELRGKLLRLRTLYISVAEKPDRLARLMFDSLMTFAVLFRHVIELHGAKAPFNKRECIEKLAEMLALDSTLFSQILKYDGKKKSPLGTEPDGVFARYLVQIQKVIEAVDSVKVDG